MKKILLLMMAMMVLGSTNANAQGFLKKLKQKAENAVGKAVIGKSAEEAEKKPKSTKKKQWLSMASMLMKKRKTTLLLCLKLQI